MRRITLALGLFIALCASALGQIGPTTGGVSPAAVIVACGATNGQLLYDNSGNCGGLTTGAGVNTLLGGAASGTGGPVGSTAPTITNPVGVSTNSNAAAGAIGEFTNAQCPGPTVTATVTITIASPAVITWTGHPFLGAAPRFDACPVVFTTSGSLPTGITSGTVYWVDPASISGNNFSISTTVANAIAGTHVNTSGTQSGTQTGTASFVLASATPKSILGLPLTAGDWDCGAQLVRSFGATTSVTILKSSINTTTDTDGSLPAGTMVQFGTAANVMVNDHSEPIGLVRQSLSGTTNVFLVADDTFTVSTNKAYGMLRCRRSR